MKDVNKLSWPSAFRRRDRVYNAPMQRDATIGEPAGENAEPGTKDDALVVLMAGQTQSRILMQAAMAESHRQHAEAAQAAAQASTIRPASATLSLSAAAELGSLVLQAIVIRGSRVPDGSLIEVIAPPWFAIFDQLRRDPNFMFQIPPDKFEELIAGAYDLAGYKTILTPRSGDLGRDVIATRSDGVTVRILDQAKRYGPGQVVGYDVIRAMLFVLDADHASKGFLTTTAAFPPNLMQDRLIAPRIGSRLELVPGNELVPRLEELSRAGYPRQS
jgi:restriction system protein